MEEESFNDEEMAELHALMAGTPPVQPSPKQSDDPMPKKNAPKLTTGAKRVLMERKERFENLPNRNVQPQVNLLTLLAPVVGAGLAVGAYWYFTRDKTVIAPSNAAATGSDVFLDALKKGAQ